MFTVQVLGLERLQAALNTVPEVVRAAQAEAMRLSVLTVEGEAKGRVPRRTGRLFSSISSKVEPLPNGMEGRVGTSVEYAHAVEFGARAHVIAPVQAQVLAFEIAGRRVYAAQVHHPGNPPKAFLRPALEHSLTAIRGYFQEAVTKVTAHLARG